jgi:hypothetical protein
MLQRNEEGDSEERAAQGEGALSNRTSDCPISICGGIRQLQRQGKDLPGSSGRRSLGRAARARRERRDVLSAAPPAAGGSPRDHRQAKEGCAGQG